MLQVLLVFISKLSHSRKRGDAYRGHLCKLLCCLT